MSESYWAYWLVLLGVVFTVIMMLIQGATTSNTQDYYQLKEITESSIVDSVDYAYYRMYGELKINREKFVENFLRRFAETVSITTQYQIDFYDLYEAPPKVSVRVKSMTNSLNVIGDETSFDIVNKLDAILEMSEDNSQCSYYTDGGGSSNNSSQNNNSSGNNGNSGNTANGNNNSVEENEENNQSSGGNTENNNLTTNDFNISPTKLAVCQEGITDTSLKGMHGTSMSNSSARNRVYENYKLTKTVGNVVPGKVFEILGAIGQYWAVAYDDASCGWVDSTYMAINLKEYIPEMSYNITNASSSIYISSGVELPGVTGRQLYSDEYKSFVPATFSFAQKLKVAAQAASRGGDRLVVYDAYRPVKVSTVAKNSLQELYNSNKTVKDNIDKSIGASGSTYKWGQSWFLAQSLSAHNTGCAVDVTIAGANMPSAMHELSVAAIKYYDAIKVRNQPLSYHSEHYAKNMTDAAKRLDKYMTEAGLDDLASEWWHYQSDTCHKTIGTGLNFWSAV